AVGLPQRARHDRPVLHARRRRGRAPGRPPARAGRRRAAVHRHARPARDRHGRRRRSARLRDRVRALSPRQRPLGMRWLFLKDLQILRRSPLLVALLVIYPIVISVLFGLALSGGPDKPKVAFANLVAPGDSQFRVGGRTLDVKDYAGRLFQSIDPVTVHSREEAIAKVRSGEVLGALVIPPDATTRLRSMLGLGGGTPPTVEVYYNAEDPVKRRFVESTIEARLAEANKALSDTVLRASAGYIDTIVRGGDVSLPLVGDINILGLQKAHAIVDGVAATLPPDSG